jgi:hypothetical protein
MIKLRDLLNEEFTAVSSKSGKTVVFKNKDARDAAVKAGTHEVPDDEKGGKDEPKGEKPNMFSKDAGYDAPDAKSDKPTKSEPFSMDTDEKDFGKELESDGFSSYVGSSLDGVSTFGDDGGNTVAIAAGSVYDSESAFVVSGFNEDDPADVKGTKEFDSKDDAIAYAKELGQELQKQNPPQKSEPKSDEPEVKVGLPSDGEEYQWSTGKKRMDVDKNVMKSVKKLSTKLKLNNPSRLEGGRKEYERKMLSLVHDALEDANFHGANRQIFADLQGKPELAKRPDYSKAPKMGTPEREKWDMNNSIYNKNFDSITIPMDDARDAISDINSQSGWDGEKTLAALLTKMRKDGAGILADKIQTSFETAMANNEAKLKLGDLI